MAEERDAGEPSDYVSGVEGNSAGQGPLAHDLLTVTQVVAYNLARGREVVGLSQVELGQRLEKLTGGRWSRATISAAESGYGGGRLRHFDADEIVAFGLALGLPVSWFFLPPPTLPSGEPEPGGMVEWITCDKSKSPDSFAFASVDLLFMALAFGRDEAGEWGGSGAKAMTARLLTEHPAFARFLAGNEQARAAARQVMELSMRIFRVASAMTGEDERRKHDDDTG